MNTQYFNLERDEIREKFSFVLLKTSRNKRYGNIRALLPLYWYADDITFFLKDQQFIENLVEIFNTFFFFLGGLKLN